MTRRHRDDRNSVRIALCLSPWCPAADASSPDTEGLALIMCSTDKEQRYKALSSGTTILESCLHLNLTEHLNSEIGLGTITSVSTAKTWLHNSFLFQRLQKNPSHYALGKDQNQTWQERLDDLVSEAVASLCDSDLVKRSEGRADGLAATEYGDIMSRVRPFIPRRNFN